MYSCCIHHRNVILALGNGLMHGDQPICMYVCMYVCMYLFIYLYLNFTFIKIYQLAITGYWLYGFVHVYKNFDFF